VLFGYIATGIENVPIFIKNGQRRKTNRKKPKTNHVERKSATSFDLNARKERGGVGQGITEA